MSNVVKGLGSGGGELDRNSGNRNTEIEHHRLEKDRNSNYMTMFPLSDTILLQCV
jgi:hypothetical protein